MPTKEQLDQASDFNQRQFVKFPYLKFISAEGSKNQSEVKSFVLLRNDENGELQAENLGKEVKVVFLNRGKFRLKNAGYTTNDIMPIKGKQVELFKKNRQTGKRNYQETGLWRDMKEKYGLSTFQFPYVLLNKEIVKLAILPSSLSNYWEYCDIFKGDDKIYEYETVLNGSNESYESPEGGVYYKIVFGQGEKLKDISNVGDKILELQEILKQQEVPETPEVEEGERAAQAIQEDMKTINIDEPSLPDEPPAEEDKEDPQVA